MAKKDPTAPFFFLKWKQKDPSIQNLDLNSKKHLEPFNTQSYEPPPVLSETGDVAAAYPNVRPEEEEEPHEKENQTDSDELERREIAVKEREYALEQRFSFFALYFCLFLLFVWSIGFFFFVVVCGFLFQTKTKFESTINHITRFLPQKK